MSDEFFFETFFQLDNIEMASKLEETIEHIELHEIDEARRALNSPVLLKAERQIEELTSPYSDYKNESNLMIMGATKYDECVSDMHISIDQTSLTGEITIEGQDHGADDLCAAIVLLLIAAGANAITAHGSAPGWSAHWYTATEGKVLLDFDSD